MARRRTPLDPTCATNEGSRRIRLLLVRQTFGAIARRVRCDESAIRFYARERRKPNDAMRARLAEPPPVGLGIAYEAWDMKPEHQP